jgi:hypothetical protein
MGLLSIFGGTERVASVGEWKVVEEWRFSLPLEGDRQKSLGGDGACACASKSGGHAKPPLGQSSRLAVRLFVPQFVPQIGSLEAGISNVCLPEVRKAQVDRPVLYIPVVDGTPPHYGQIRPN